MSEGASRPWLVNGWIGRKAKTGWSAKRGSPEAIISRNVVNFYKNIMIIYTLWLKTNIFSKFSISLLRK